MIFFEMERKMKKFLRVFVPILMVIAIVLCLMWYLFVYDRAFTRDILLYGARFSDKHNNPAIAAWFYDLAYNQSVDSDEVAIELAEQHKADGNYTQAEVILAQAIEDNSSAALYAALSQTYVDQDKILDAVKLLDGITNPAILADLETMRPAAPTASLESGFYNQYIPVEISAESGTLYVNPNGQYPSIASDLYAEPITLVGGESQLYAVAVAENGLVSPLSVFTYTVGGVIEEVTFSDPAVELAVRQRLSVPANTVLMTNQLWDITSFTMPVEAKSYADLKYMPYLQELTIANGVSGELEVLSNLTGLTKLRISDTPVRTEELDVIGKLIYLQELTLSNCGLSTTAPISNLTSLTYLNLSDNTIRNIQPLQVLTGLTQLNLSHNVLTDLADLASLAKLTDLDISYNALTTLNPIRSLTGLTRLDASHNTLNTLEGVDQLTALQYLELDSNTITDISPLATCSVLTELRLANNQLTNISAVAELLNLAVLDFSYNQVTELPEFSGDCNLVTIDGSHNLLKSVKPLSVVMSLNHVYMDYNEKLTSIKSLASCYNLVLVNVYGTGVTEIKALTDRSIVVNYDPTK